MKNSNNNDAFLKIWPTCYITFTAVIGLLAVVFLFLTELGSVAAHFWYGNVFAGGWCGLVMLIHTIFVFIAGACAPSRQSAYRAMIVSVAGAIASTAMISFDAVFLINNKICILTPSCASNAVSNTTFSFSLQSSFLQTFRGMDLFKLYTENNSKVLFQSIQIGLGCVCLLICIIYIIVFYVHDNKAKEQSQPTGQTIPPSYQMDPSAALVANPNQSSLDSNQNFVREQINSPYNYPPTNRPQHQGVQSTQYYPNPAPYHPDPTPYHPDPTPYHPDSTPYYRNPPRNYPNPPRNYPNAPRNYPNAPPIWPQTPVNVPEGPPLQMPFNEAYGY